ncbi:MAG: hypothetical protein IPG51_04030 [Chloroflexi bacterium]|nr:hypothetical protein [Chloroflexota bacterium]
MPPPRSPHGGFTDPEYGSVGLTEAEALAQGGCAIAAVPYSDPDRAVIDGRAEGFCKLIVNRESGQIVGAHVVGEQAVEVVQIVAAGMASGNACPGTGRTGIGVPDIYGRGRFGGAAVGAAVGLYPASR